jgi:gluconolactonase
MMKVALFSLTSLVVVLGCGGSGGTDKPASTAGTSNGGGGAGTSGGAGGTGGSGAGMTAGGSQSQSGSASGGSTSGSGSGGSSAGAGAGGGGTGGGSGGGSQAFSCPSGAVEAPKLTGLTVMRVEGVPPADSFNNNNNDATNIEGPVWIGDSLYVSEIASSNASRVLKITAAGQVSIAIPADSGTNGLATNAQGELFGAVHKDGSISKLSLSGGAAVPVVTMFMGARFSSPNDLTFHKNGTLYFSDPKWQAPTPNPQSAMRAYRVPVGGEPVAIEELEQPNGMTLSKNQDVLYIGGGQLKKYPVMADGTLGTGSTFVQGGQSDGMVIDCADNLYTTGNGVTVYSPAGMEIGKISVNNINSVTNVAFGGADHKTLYITSQGNKDQKGLWKVAMNIAGMPY